MTTRLSERLGHCYVLSAKDVTYGLMLGTEDRLNVRLVHGSIQGDGRPRIGHAWVEYDDVIHEPTPGAWPVPTITVSYAFDPVWDEALPTDAYYRIMNAELEIAYQPEEARTLMRMHGHYGPWHDREDAT